MKEKIKSFYQQEWTMNEKVLLSLVLALAGIVIGMLLAPAKKRTFGCNNGNQYGKPEAIEENPKEEEKPEEEEE